METDLFFYKFFKTLPPTFFEMLGMPGSRARPYRFDSVELKKAFRIDGMFLPRSNNLPLYFVEVQYQRIDTFYANLFAKVFCYLEENDPAQDWRAVAIFDSRRTEPAHLAPYEVLLVSRHVHRVYLDECPIPPNPTIGLSILQLLNAPKTDALDLAGKVVEKLRSDLTDSTRALGGNVEKVIQLVEELVMIRYPEYDREEVRNVLKLGDIRKSKAWQEIHQEALAEGLEKGMEKGALQKQEELICRCLAQGKSVQEIAELFGLPVKEVRRLTKKAAK